MELERRKPFALIIAPLLLVLTATFISSLALGTVSIPPGQVFRLLLSKIGGLSGGLSGDPELALADSIIWHIRLPRSIAAVFAGAALALSGTAVQGVFRNPMASPDILGISAGSSLGAVLVIVTGLQAVHPLILPLVAFGGAMLTTFVVYLIGAGSSHLLFVILAGLGLSSFFGGLVSVFLLFANRYEVSQFLFWTLGGLDGVLPERLIWTLPGMVIGGGASPLYGQTLEFVCPGR